MKAINFYELKNENENKTESKNSRKSYVFCQLIERNPDERLPVNYYADIMLSNFYKELNGNSEIYL